MDYILKLKNADEDLVRAIKGVVKLCEDARLKVQRDYSKKDIEILNRIEKLDVSKKEKARLRKAIKNSYAIEDSPAIKKINALPPLPKEVEEKMRQELLQECGLIETQNGFELVAEAKNV
ncbi:hypothetical protein DCO58_03840 [Helicobacter saguini]|uniref:Uncharacterized protein n=1 Tax=Helicobacter saguini TaxID=1548018 RepID=A0A347VSH3_9HELI|nr:hypothetical protein [Helicobacter saguini]MWV62507.1 hypothetical protein [Helicobacter saguini]MWV66820.1 hypothetical protein [Helicobacter saguini]MWV69170.1 hypothetical protein [Helicobacter saguini]MWV71275.1 hypothetical protein [Helicobacter saguini]TLD94210.1 hypothetical protein LS64_006855 [Helicobacter saguini]